MILCFKVSDKIAEVFFVTLRIWFNVAIWRTVRSALTGWHLKRTGTVGFRLTNPWFGTSAAIWLGRSK